MGVSQLLSRARSEVVVKRAIPSYSAPDPVLRRLPASMRARIAQRATRWGTTSVTVDHNTSHLTKRGGRLEKFVARLLVGFELAVLLPGLRARDSRHPSA